MKKKTITTIIKEYDEKGRVIKETRTTEEEFGEEDIKTPITPWEKYPTYPNPVSPWTPWVTYTTTDGTEKVTKNTSKVGSFPPEIKL